VRRRAARAGTALAARFAGFVHVTFKDYFSRLATQYAEFRPRYPGALFDFLLRISSADARVWDCACGSGQATLDLAERFEHVIATDASPQQIAQAKPHPRVEYRVAHAEESRVESNSIDLITVAQALHWFDRPRFYVEAKRVLRPNGLLAAWTYGLPRFNDVKIDPLMKTFYTETVGPFWPPERRYVEEGYRTLEFPFTEVACPSLSMRENWTLAQFLGYLRSWSATARYMDEHGKDPVTALTEELAPIWGDPQRVRAVSWPLSIKVGRV
jgi:ubiquinone/menaquinone biosynthesis C-methylase UbiE